MARQSVSGSAHKVRDRERRVDGPPRRDSRPRSEAARAEEELAKAKAGNAALQKFITIRHQPDKVQEPPLKIVKPFALAAMLFAFTASAQFPPPYVHNILDTNGISAGTGIVISHAGGIATIAATGGGTNVNYFFVDANGNVTTLSNVYLPNVFVGNVIFTNWTFVNGLTTNVALLAANGSTNTLQFYGGILTNIVGTIPTCTGSAITANPSNVSSLTNLNVSFSVTATGTAPISYQWLSNNVNVGNGTDFSGATTSTLIVSNVTIAKNDGEVFKCTVWNCGATNTSSTATLTVTNGVPGGGNALLVNLEAYWKCEDADNANWVDASGNSHTLVKHGNILKTALAAKNNFGRDVAPSTYADNSEATFRRTASWTLAGWCNVSADVDSVVLASEFATGHNWFIFGPGGNVFEFGMRKADDSGSILAVSTTTMTHGTYHLVVVGWDSVAQKIWIQVDNETRVETSYTDTPRTDAENFTINGISGGGSGITSSSNVGGVDEIGYWTRSLSTGDVSNLWAAGAGLFYDSFTN